MSASAGPVNADRPRLTWSLVIATRNRVDTLPTTVHFALRQTRPPIDVVVVDSSDASKFAEGAAAVSAAVESSGLAVDLTHDRWVHPSTTAQRNRGAELAKGDVLFMIDDDSFMHEDFADKVMSVYDRDTEARVAGVQGTMAGPPGKPVRRPKATHWKFWLRLWFTNFVMFQDNERSFVPYDGSFHTAPMPDWLRERGAVTRGVLHGCRMTLRREAVLAHRFEEAFYRNGPCEDQDGSYRVSRSGLLVELPDAYLQHVSAPPNRQQLKTIRAMNQIDHHYIVRKHSNRLSRDRWKLRWRLARYVFGDTVRDLGGKRWGMPRVRGHLQGWRAGRRLFRVGDDELLDVYHALRERITPRLKPEDLA
ncbi:MAG: glycosyltransferase family 2 protein [Planctomycetota bacterium]